jgi:hypothetical protein
MQDTSEKDCKGEKDSRTRIKNRRKISSIHEKVKGTKINKENFVAEKEGIVFTQVKRKKGLKTMTHKKNDPKKRKGLFSLIEESIVVQQNRIHFELF